MTQNDELQKQVSALAKEIHLEMFPEEYDFMLDDIADSKTRAKGINPMNQEYIAMVNTRRRKLGFEPLLPNGMAPDQKTHDWSLNEAKVRLGIQGSV